MRFAEILAGLFAHRRGAVSLLAALALPCLIGTAGLVVEYGHGVLEKVENQRVADLSAYAGAVAYNAATPTSTATTAMTSAAQPNNWRISSSPMTGLVARLSFYPA